MREEPTASQAPASFAELPIQPTGSGVQDLGVAYEQMKLSEADQESSESMANSGVHDATPNSNASVPTVDDEATRMSAAHPS